MKWWIAGSRRKYFTLDTWERAFAETVKAFDRLNLLPYKPNYIKTKIRTGGEKTGVDNLIEKYVKLINKAQYMMNPFTGKKIDLMKPYEAEWTIYGRGAGKIRNTKGINWADKVLVIWTNSSPGSKDVITKAMKQKKLVEIIHITADSAHVEEFNYE